MKTKIITGLKKEVLMVELPEQWTFNIYKDQIGFCNEINKPIEQIKGSFTLLGKPDEIKEEDAKAFVDRDKSVMFEYKNYNGGKRFLTALESLLSALESEIYWSNPFENPDKNKGKYTDRFGDVYLGKYEEDFKQWKKTQEKTFDRKITLIFVKD